jgi:hypothetical protein
LDSLEVVGDAAHHQLPTIAVACPQCQTDIPVSFWDTGPVARCPRCDRPLTLSETKGSVSAVTVYRDDSDDEVAAAPVRRRRKARSSATARRWLWWVVGGGASVLFLGGILFAVLFLGGRPRGTTLISTTDYRKCRRGQLVSVLGKASEGEGEGVVVIVNLVWVPGSGFVELEGGRTPVGVLCQRRRGETFPARGSEVLVTGIVTERFVDRSLPMLMLEDCTFAKG